MRSVANAIRRLGGDRGGTSAIEFALILPILLTVYFGGYQVSQIASAYRKVTLTARAVADLTTQYTTMGTSDVANVLGASSQIMVPFNTANLSIVLTEYSVTVGGVASVTWSKALNGTALKAGTIVILPTGVVQPSSSIVMAVVTYNYAPPVGYKLTGSFPMTSSIYMSPRQVGSIPYTGT